MRATYVGVGPGERLYNQVISEILKRKLTRIKEAYSLKDEISSSINEDNIGAVEAAIEFYFDEYTRTTWDDRTIEEYMLKHMR